MQLQSQVDNKPLKLDGFDQAMAHAGRSWAESPGTTEDE